MTMPTHSQTDTVFFDNAETAQKSPELVNIVDPSKLRYPRVIYALLFRSLFRVQCQGRAGSSHVSDLFSRTLNSGLGKAKLLCTMTKEENLDRKPMRFGVHMLSDPARKVFNTWSAKAHCRRDMSRSYLFEFVILPVIEGAVAMAVFIALNLIFGGGYAR